MTSPVHRNNFDSLRLIASILVILSHSYHLTGQAEPLRILTHNLTGFGHIGVTIFFVISGYLIAQSWQRQPALFPYFMKRILRLWPGLICVTLFTVFVLGPLLTSLAFSEYFASAQTYRYLLNLFFIRQVDTLPGIFESTLHATPLVNGSLWTLGVEWLMYIVVALLGLIFKRPLPVLCLIAIGLYTATIYTELMVPGDFHSIFGNFSIYASFSHMCAFVFGMICCHYQTIFKYTPQLILGGLVLLIFLLGTDYDYALFLPLVCLGTLAIGRAYTSSFHLLSARGDYSYGIYIYAFPIQQMLIHFSEEKLSPMVLFFIAFALTYLAGMISWHYIEKPALGWKTRLVKTPISSPHDSTNHYV